MNVNEKLAALRQKMLENKLDAYIIPSADPHQTEYVAACWKDREWISGFNGSSGTVIVTMQFAGLWADSRYYLQAEQQLAGSEMQLVKIVNQFEPEHLEWLKENLGMGTTVGIDGNDLSYAQYLQMEKIFQPLHMNIDVQYDLISEIWLDRPALPINKVFIHDTDLVESTAKEKLSEVVQYVKDQDASHYIFTLLDDIAWLLNLRGSDVQYNPLFVSFLIVGQDEIILFIDEQKLSPEVLAHLAASGVITKPYTEIVRYLNRIDENSNVIVENSSINYKLYRAINGQKVNKDSIARIRKGIKSEKEINHFRNAMIDDGAALAESFKWMMDSLGKVTFTECDLADHIASQRSKIADYKGESFGAIIGYKGNGAIVHYNAEPSTAASIMKEGVLLVDCGGQYERGTTDITRTFALNEVSEQIKKHYTLVLKGHLALSMVKFPVNTTCAALDVLARQFLWEEGLNYLHGTGHGIGFFLNVHEGPHGFASATTDRGRTTLKPGMIITNEPGLYIQDQYGIRIENVLVVKESNIEGFLEFETITLYPYDFNMLDERLLSTKEKSWVNNYHRMVFDKVSPLLDEKTREWFGYRCKMFG
jgi:Xaa-Pro aminopeptidase